MALSEVTGIIKSEIEPRREKYEKWRHDRYEHKKSSNNYRPPFEEAFCLAKIPRQPPEYDGPPRYCLSQKEINPERGHRCKFHGGAGRRNDENLIEPHLAPMKHGMKATREHLVDSFDEKDQALYDWIVDNYIDAYGLDADEDPSITYNLHRLAAEIVRAERGRGFLLEEGEVNETPVRNEEGRVVVDENGDVVTEKSEHYLNKMMRAQDKKITEFERELVVSRRERQKNSNEETNAEVAKGLVEIGASMLARDDNEYSPDNKPWEDEE